MDPNSYLSFWVRWLTNPVLRLLTAVAFGLFAGIVVMDVSSIVLGALGASKEIIDKFAFVAVMFAAALASVAAHRMILFYIRPPKR